MGSEHACKLAKALVMARAEDAENGRRSKEDSAYMNMLQALRDNGDVGIKSEVSFPSLEQVPRVCDECIVATDGLEADPDHPGSMYCPACWTHWRGGTELAQAQVTSAGSLSETPASLPQLNLTPSSSSPSPTQDVRLQSTSSSAKPPSPSSISESPPPGIVSRNPVDQGMLGTHGVGDTGPGGETLWGGTDDSPQPPPQSSPARSADPWGSTSLKTTPAASAATISPRDALQFPPSSPAPGSLSPSPTPLQDAFAASSTWTAPDSWTSPSLEVGGSAPWSSSALSSFWGHENRPAQAQWRPPDALLHTKLTQLHATIMEDGTEAALAQKVMEMLARLPDSDVQTCLDDPSLRTRMVQRCLQKILQPVVGVLGSGM
jgi:hypothetical protein